MTEDPRSTVARLEVQKLELPQNAELAANNQVLAAAASAFMSAPVAQLIVERNGTVRGGNEAAASLLAVGLDRLRERTLDALVTAPTRNDVRQFLEAAFERGRATCEVVLAGSESRVTLAATILACGQTCVCVVTSDRPDRLEDARRAASLHTLANGVSSRLETLLADLLVDLQAGPEGGTSDVVTALAAARKAADRAAEITGALRAYTATRTLDCRAMDLASILAALEPLVRLTAGTAKTLFTLPDKPVVVRGDAAGLSRIVLELVENASDAGARAIRITLAVWRMTTGQVDALDTLPELAPGDYAVVEVSDDGYGVPVDLRRRMFDPFVSTRGTGRGLGLSVAQGIAVAHQGAIVLDTSRESDKGARLRLFVPVQT